MTLAQLEAWVLETIKLVKRGAIPEDDRVELKAEWPVDPRRAARRIAGHANQAGTDEILWIIGLDEKKGVVPFQPVDPAKWWSQVEPCFDGLAPIPHWHNVPSDEGPVVALLFDTSGIPFVVTVPSGPEGVTREVPWRSSTSLRSAKRLDLVELLVPTIGTPEIEVRTAVVMPGGAGNMGSLEGDVYIVPRSHDRVVIPFHRCSGEIVIGDDVRPLSRLSLAPPGLRFLVGRDRGRENASLTIEGTGDELIVDGPGRARLRALCEPEPPFPTAKMVRVRLMLRAVHHRSTIPVAVDLEATPNQSGSVYWKYEP